MKHVLVYSKSLILFQGKMDSMPKLKIFVMLLSLATFTAMVILNAGNATGLFKGNARECFLFREMSLVHCVTL